MWFNRLLRFDNGINEVIMTDTTGILSGMIVTGSASIPSNTTVSGVTDDAIYLSANTTGSILSGVSLSFTYTPYTLGINVGDTVNISGSGVSNLDGTHPVSGATDTATSFTIRTENLVVALATDIPAGAITINNNLVLRNNNVIIGNAETSTAPVDGAIRGADGLGADVGGGALTIEAGLGTGNATGGDIIMQTGEVGSTGELAQTSTTRLTIDTSGNTEIQVTQINDVTAIKVPVGTTAHVQHPTGQIT